MVRDRNGTIVSVEDQVDGREESECILSRSDQLIRNNAVPERIEGRRGEDLIASIGSQIEVIEGKLLVVPEEIENAGLESISCLGVGIRSRSIVLRLVKVCENQVVPVCGYNPIGGLILS